MEDKICIDTHILVDFLRSKPHAVHWIGKYGHAILGATLITFFELYYGAYASERVPENVRSVEKLSQRLVPLNLSDESVRMAGEILAELNSQGEQIEFRDLLIGTTALAEGFKLKTKNVKHFSRYGELFCRNKVIDELIAPKLRNFLSAPPDKFRKRTY